MRALLVLAFGLWTALPAAAQDLNDRETVINSTTAGSQHSPRAAQLSDGSVVIVYATDDSDPERLLGQILNPDGTPRGDEFEVDTTPSGRTRFQHSVSQLSDGGFVVAFEIDTPDRQTEIRARLFDNDGTPRGEDFLVHSRRDNEYPVVVRLCGRFLIAWWTRSSSDTPPDTNGRHVRYRIYENDGTPVGDDAVLNQVYFRNQHYVAAAPIRTCDAMIVWADWSGDARLRGRLYRGATQAFDDEYTLIDDIDVLSAPSLVGRPTGELMISLEDRGPVGRPGSMFPDPYIDKQGGFAIRARSYFPNGQAHGDAVDVWRNPQSYRGRPWREGRNVRPPSIVALDSGGYLIAWADIDPVGGATHDAIRLQRIGEGSVLDGESRLYQPDVRGNAFARISSPAIVALPGGRAMILWSGHNLAGPDDDGSSIHAIRLSTPGLPPADLRAAALPSARSGTIAGHVITAYFMVAATQAGDAQSCQVTAPDGAPLTLVSRSLDGANRPFGPYNPVFDLAAGGFASLVLFMTPTATTDADGYAFTPRVTCANGTVDAFTGTNAVHLTIETVEGPDILSIGATPSQDGVVRIGAPGGGAMGVAAINIGEGDGSAGAGEATITVTAHTGGTALPVAIALCETDPATGQCLSPPAAAQTAVFSGTTPRTFTVFVRSTGTGGIAFRPADHRVWIEFRDANGVLRSSTSAAITAPGGN